MARSATVLRCCPYVPHLHGAHARASCSALADRLTLISAADPVDEVALRRFVADANRLMSADAATGHQLLGRVAALRWDVHEMKRRHRLSVSLGDPVLSRCNFAHSLSIVGLTDDALEVALEASEHAPDDLFALNVLINAALANGRLRDAQRHLNRWRKLSLVNASVHVYGHSRSASHGCNPDQSMSG